jgi:hypothetical protein
LNSIIQECGFSAIDLLSIDVEGAEFQVLQGLDFAKYRPKLILLEDKHVFLNKHRFLRKKGYRLVKRTGMNCWYVEKHGKRPQQTCTEQIKLWKRLYLSIWWKKLKLAIRNRNLAPFSTL